MDLNTVIFALLGGVLPSLLWLWFWLREDKNNPEPFNALLIAFVAGALSVFAALFLEKGVQHLVENIFTERKALLITMGSWAVIEETLKYVFAYFSSLKKTYYDEPIDGMIYMITVALGFAAMENTLFLLDPVAQNNLFESIFTGNMRFLGATLLHILASSIVGIGLALSFGRNRKIKIIFISISLVLASILHFVFNYAISVLNYEIMQTFAFVWIALVFLLLVFEKVKRLKF